MTHHGKPEEHEGSGPEEPPAGDHEVDPADNPGPRGDEEVDSERLERDEEDLGRAGAN
jgi:hypothetical protein